MLSKEEIYQRRVEQIKRQAEELEKTKITYKHNEDGIDWGMGDDQPEEQESDSEDISNVDVEKLKKRNDLNDNQKKIVKQINDLNKRIGALLDKNKVEHSTENDVEIFQMREDVFI
jgi:prefoldin subunit 5